MSGTDKKNKYQEFKESVHLYLHADNPFANALGYVEKYTKVDRQYIALGQSPLLKPCVEISVDNFLCFLFFL